MPRTHARVLTSIWADSDWRALSPEAQRVYVLILSQPKLSYCGVVAYTPRRWATLAAGDTLKAILKAIRDLAAGRFVVVDEETEELWVRSFVVHDGLFKSPNLVKAMWKDFAEVQSKRIREGFLEGLPEPFRQPPTEPPPQGNPEGLPEPLGEPNGDGSRVHGAGLPLPLPLLLPVVDPSPNHHVGLSLVGNGEMDQPSGPPTPPVRTDPLLDRLLSAWPEKRRGGVLPTIAGVVLAEARRWLDERLIDEVIGHMLAMAPPPSTPRYLLVVAPDWAQQRGANLSAQALASMAEAAKSPSERSSS